MHQVTSSELLELAALFFEDFRRTGNPVWEGVAEAFVADAIALCPTQLCPAMRRKDRGADPTSVHAHGLEEGHNEQRGTMPCYNGEG